MATSQDRNVDLEVMRHGKLGPRKHRVRDVLESPSQVGVLQAVLSNMLKFVLLSVKIAPGLCPLMCPVPSAPSIREHIL